MRDFLCPNCDHHLVFENSVCLSCGSQVGFSFDDMAFLVIAAGAEHAGAVDATEYQLCANLYLAECNWLVEVEPVHSSRQRRVRHRATRQVGDTA